MQAIAVAFPLWVHIAAWVLGVALLVWLLRTMTWDDVFIPGRVQQILVAMAGLIIIWSMRVEAIDGLAMHFLGIAIITLVFSWQLAMLMVSVTVLALAALGIVPWVAIPFTILLNGVLPIWAVWRLLRLSEQRLPPHLFIYLYVVGFLGGALSVLVVMVAKTLLFGVLTDITWDVLISEYFRYTLLLVLPEGVLNGMVITALVMFRPEWVATYSDARYLEGR